MNTEKYSDCYGTAKHFRFSLISNAKCTNIQCKRQSVLHATAFVNEFQTKCIHQIQTHAHAHTYTLYSERMCLFWHTFKIEVYDICWTIWCENHHNSSVAKSVQSRVAFICQHLACICLYGCFLLRVARWSCSFHSYRIEPNRIVHLIYLSHIRAIFFPRNLYPLPWKICKCTRLRRRFLSGRTCSASIGLTWF